MGAEGVSRSFKLQVLNGEMLAFLSFFNSSNEKIDIEGAFLRKSRKKVCAL